ncbi:putative membrane protein [Cystobacter fuscus DSM 2262]|uniref:Membrane protein n=1 Tax=Cystobacter fuscus (strain ATCC 25194 / DSM 2262 / NBRC 100088 / M29) TaxID=1242864 RepID=S9PE31_CYSF2|nr:DMT family transporter [Cystobacter fuscus]EPX61331.1 putative membrane protein [Cystobacter fuscus DSM 2262]
MHPSRLYLLAAAALWSTAGVLVKLSTLTAWQLASGRSLIAAVALALALPAGRKRPSARGLLATLAYAATVVTFIVANKLTTSANAIFLQDTAPLYVLLLSPLVLGERPSRGEWMAVPVFLLGLSLFFLDQLNPGQFWGNMVALASGVTFASCILGLRATRGEGTSVLVWGNVLAGLATLVPALEGPRPTAMDLGMLVFLGVFQLGCAYALFERGLRETPALEASLLILLEPVLNPVWTFLFVGERPGPWALVGGTIILLATAWRTLSAAPSGSSPPAREET